MDKFELLEKIRINLLNDETFVSFGSTLNVDETTLSITLMTDGKEQFILKIEDGKQPLYPEIIRKSSKIDRVIAALRETSEAIDALPPMFRRKNMFGMLMIDSENLKNEAQWLEETISTIKTELEE